MDSADRYRQFNKCRVDSFFPAHAKLHFRNSKIAACLQRILRDSGSLNLPIKMILFFRDLHGQKPVVTHVSKHNLIMFENQSKKSKYFFL